MMKRRTTDKLEIWFISICFLLIVGFVVLVACVPRRSVPVEPGRAKRSVKTEVMQPSNMMKSVQHSSTIPLRSDTDGDGDIDLEDYARMIQDFTGPTK